MALKLTDDRGREFNISVGFKCLLVSALEKNAAAAEALVIRLVQLDTERKQEILRISRCPVTYKPGAYGNAEKEYQEGIEAIQNALRVIGQVRISEAGLLPAR